MPTKKKRPSLTPTSPSCVLVDYYWLKSELCDFARTHGLPVSGKKREIRKRIERFLRDGKKPIRKRPAKSKQGTWDSEVPIHRRTRVRRWKCDAPTRAFFEQELGPKFHFSVALNKRARSGEAGLTYGALVDAWSAEKQKRRDPSYKVKLGTTGEYNIYVRAFYADGKNAGKGIKDVAKAWNRCKGERGPRVYRPKRGW